MRQTLTDNFWGIHKNMNCAFPLTGFLSCSWWCFSVNGFLTDNVLVNNHLSGNITVNIFKFQAAVK